MYYSKVIACFILTIILLYMQIKKWNNSIVYIVQNYYPGDFLLQLWCHHTEGYLWRMQTVLTFFCSCRQIVLPGPVSLTPLQYSNSVWALTHRDTYPTILKQRTAQTCPKPPKDRLYNLPYSSRQDFNVANDL